ncbi:hypothetical protein [Photobacterium alginatilyticum]|uniref:hypothetical protein n=1 Tax=Photobacterium alginatilyticum TaxID=1775171 RepID=UPI00136E334D|nr:hypothetical protein [Photobacterium alginatilyticum]
MKPETAQFTTDVKAVVSNILMLAITTALMVKSIFNLSLHSLQVFMDLISP